MDIVRIEDFPSDTNLNNFLDDVQRALPSVSIHMDTLNDAVVIPIDQYEEYREQITEFAKWNGGTVFRPV